MPTGGTSVFGSMFATWRAKPRTSVNRNAQVAYRSGGSVAHSIASFRGDGRDLALLHEGDEIGDPSCLMVVLVSKPLAHAQIPLERGTQTGHCTPPGHGRLNVRSASISTFA